MRDTKQKLLLVDDEPDIRLVLSAILTEMGHEVRSAEDGFAALREIHDWMPDILLSDLNMPGMSGFELLSIVRRRLPGIYVIATSGAYSGETVPRGIAADAFYEKATGMRTLLTVHETQCLYCKATIYYAMIRPMDGRSSLQNMPGLGPALAA